MQFKETHVVFSMSAAGWIKKDISKNVIIFYDDLSIGPLRGNRNKFFKEVYGYKLINPKLRAGKLIIWYVENSFEELGLMKLISELKDFSNVYLMKFKKMRIKGLNGYYIPRQIGEIPSEILVKNYCPKKITLNEIKNFKKEFYELEKDNYLLRINVNGKFVSKSVDYYDNKILEFAKQYSKPARIIGEIIKDELVNTTFLIWRIKELVRNKKLKYVGKLETIRDFEIVR